MITSVVSKEYQALQKEIVKLQEKWKQQIDPDSVRPNLDKAALATGIPAAALTAFDFDISLFLQWLDELAAVLIKHRPELEDRLAGIGDLLTPETAMRWLEEAFAVNEPYFSSFALEHGLEEWIPQFLAETTLRPYLQLTAVKVQPEIQYAVSGTGCPVCGEPERLAVLDEDGKKVMQCPRCLAHWHVKRLECAHCGNEDHTKIKFLTIEGDSVSQIQVCEECNGYIKIIDTRQYIEKPNASLLDLNSIHLDFVALEQGYTAAGTKSGSES